MKKLDFIIVGAQKCATTTLHEYLNTHPDIFLPADKEAPFFNREDFHLNEYPDYLQKNFPAPQAANKKVWGKASPQYMSSPLIPARIKRANSQTKVVAVLRDPIKRALSHYRMAVKRGTEKRSFEEAMLSALRPMHLTAGRQNCAPMHAQGYESEAEFYAAWGEYGRILKGYLDEFGRDRLLIIFTEDLESNPEVTLDKLLQFLGLEPGWRPACLGERFHKGGGQPVVNPVAIRKIAQLPIVNQLYSLVPEKNKEVLRKKVASINLRKASEKHVLSKSTEARLKKFYRRDLHRLVIMGFTPPWDKQLFPG